jgi:hypothetical protein
MEGGVGILLLLVLLVVAVGFGIALYVTGGALGSGKNAAGDDDEGPPPEHKRPTGPVQEHVEFVGTGGERERERS